MKKKGVHKTQKNLQIQYQYKLSLLLENMHAIEVKGKTDLNKLIKLNSNVWLHPYILVYISRYGWM